ncbi:MAG: hypothetical protein IH600_03975 [Bacteroidetes bacterium]|nr:hypothetical protein [Bacteroidota bacterium]
MKSTSLLFTILVSCSLLAGCYYDNEEALYPQLNSGCDTTNVTYAGSVVPVLVGSCYSCHSNANAASFGDNIRLESYSDVKSNLTRLYGAITWDPKFTRMPKNSGKLDDCSIRIIEIWMAQGAPNNIVPQGGVR